MMYIAKDGSYGDAEDILIVDTSAWSGDDWEDFNQAAEDEDAFLMEDIALSINKRKGI